MIFYCQKSIVRWIAIYERNPAAASSHCNIAAVDQFMIDSETRSLAREFTMTHLLRVAAHAFGRPGISLK